jgi:hypothetical protein
MGNSIALNSFGFPVIGYYHQNSAIKCAIYGESGWHVNVVDSIGTGPVSLALDASGTPNISYMTGSGELRYALKIESEWNIQTVDSLGNVGLWTSIALDSAQFPHISYFDESRADLKYTYRDELGWHIQRVDSAGDVGMCTSIALDDNDSPHISYFDDSNNDLNYAFLASSGWHIETVDTSLDEVSNTSLALDQSNNPHISYWCNSSLKYAYRNTSGWHIEYVDQAENTLSSRSIALDSSDLPHISYFDFSGLPGELKYAFKEGIEWRIETLDVLLDLYSARSCLVLTESGSPCIFCSSGAMLYAYLEHSEWQFEYVGYLWSSGSNSLALDAIGNPHITVHSQGPRGSGLLYVFYDNSGWHTETIESRGSGSDLGDVNSIAIDASGYSHVSYHDGNYNDLRYAIGRPIHIVLSGEVVDDQLVLEWSPIPAADAFEVCGASNLPHFVPHLWGTDLYVLDVLSSDITTWSSPNGIGDPNENWTYLVLVVNWCEQEIARSNRIGEHDFDLSFGQ